MTNISFKKLTKVQLEVLKILNVGKIMTFDSMNLAYIGSRNVAPSTRYFLTSNKYVTRKDKTKAITTKGNGYIISKTGEKVLLLNQSIKKRGRYRILMKEKKCPKCNIVKPISTFVNIYGFENPRGKYCRNCYLENELAFAKQLMEGRDYCLYCGKKIKRVYEWTMEGKTTRTYIQRDHMDPVSLGGADNARNTVYCCVECNRRKGNKTFSDWLKSLAPYYRKVSRVIYINKHQRTPEEFRACSNYLEIILLQE
ncbi:MAG: hypothetical protein DRQ01_07105 [Ignavibacteriae bacterium]|nr:MAG: hypothetical protein DRQ01_07105 [Ignavibacteriota bacterium]